MKFFLRDAKSVFNNISNYFLVVESKDICDRYCELEFKMMKCLNNLENIIHASMDSENNSNTKIVYDYFVEISTLMDLLFKVYKIYFKVNKTRKFASFYTEFGADSTEEDKKILQLEWYLEVAEVRNLKIHDYEDLEIFCDDNKLFFQHFDEIEHPTIVSEYSDNRFYVDFSLYAIDKLNIFLNLLGIVFEKIVERKSIYSKEELEKKSQKYKIYKVPSLSNHEYDDIYNYMLSIKDDIDIETEQILRFLRKFKRDEEKLSTLISLIDKGDFNELPKFYKSEAYFQLSIIKYQKGVFEDGITLLWKCMNEIYNSTFLSNLLYGYLKVPSLLDDNTKIKLENLIAIHIQDCFMDRNWDFFNNASSYFRFTNREEQALDLAEMGVNINPVCYHLDLLYNYGCLLKRSGNISNFIIAKNVFLHIIQLEPTDSLVYQHLIECYFQLQEYDNLTKYLHEARKKFPEDLEFVEQEHYLKENLDI